MDSNKFRAKMKANDLDGWLEYQRQYRKAWGAKNKDKVSAINRRYRESQKEDVPQRARVIITVVPSRK